MFFSKTYHTYFPCNAKFVFDEKNNLYSDETKPQSKYANLVYKTVFFYIPSNLIPNSSYSLSLSHACMCA